jgi:hypothetical protein
LVWGATQRSAAQEYPALFSFSLKRRLYKISGITIISPCFCQISTFKNKNKPPLVVLALPKIPPIRLWVDSKRSFGDFVGGT